MSSDPAAVKHGRSASASGSVPGADAETPAQIPARGWLQILRRSWKEAGKDQVPLLAAGVAFYGFLSIFPAMVALILSYAMVADPSTLSAQVASMTEALPADARQLIISQLQALATSQGRTVGLGAAVAILLALWSAAGGIGNLMTAINAAYDEEETRGFVRRKAMALLFTLAAIVFMLVVLVLVAAVPALLDQVDSALVRFLLQVLRWALLAGAVTVALAVLYRYSPSRDEPKLRWVSVGAVTATVLWLVASAGFSLYVSYFGNYAKTYGALASVVVLLFWLWITAYAVLLGAEMNAESEEQTVADTTKGPPQPIGSRGAVKADSTPGDTTS
ncbi:MAG TPA: YihY/virulence factor BrkB family protein [Dermatophilaceae bacterium]|nr:YihY/virulence factor BrkB family protein [Dermatophilaceae bacterium]